MEYIGIGILFAIGFVFAPIIIEIALMIIAIPFMIIASIFKGLFK